MTRPTRHGEVPRSAAEDAWRLLVGLVRESRPEWRRKVVEATGLPFSRVRALWRLAGGPRTLVELAGDIGADAPATTVVVNALEERGLVKRAPHPTDRRAKQVSLTAAGRRMLAVVDAIPDPPPAALERLPAHELQRLRATLDKLA